MDHQQVAVGHRRQGHVLGQVVALKQNKTLYVGEIFFLLEMDSLAAYLEAHRPCQVVHGVVVPRVLDGPVGGGQREPVPPHVRQVRLADELIRAHVGQHNRLHAGDPLLHVLNPKCKREGLIIFLKFFMNTLCSDLYFTL